MPRFWFRRSPIPRHGAGRQNRSRSRVSRPPLHRSREPVSRSRSSQRNASPPKFVRPWPTIDHPSAEIAEASLLKTRSTARSPAFRGRASQLKRLPPRGREARARDDRAIVRDRTRLARERLAGQIARLASPSQPSRGMPHDRTPTSPFHGMRSVCGDVERVTTEASSRQVADAAHAGGQGPHEGLVSAAERTITVVPDPDDDRPIMARAVSTAVERVPPGDAEPAHPGAEVASERLRSATPWLCRRRPGGSIARVPERDTAPRAPGLFRRSHESAAQHDRWALSRTHSARTAAHRRSSWPPRR